MDDHSRTWLRRIGLLFAAFLLLPFTPVGLWPVIPLGIAGVGCVITELKNHHHIRRFRKALA